MVRIALKYNPHPIFFGGVMLCVPIISLVGHHLLYGVHIIVDGVLKRFNEVIVYGWHISMDCVTMSA